VSVVAAWRCSPTPSTTSETRLPPSIPLWIAFAMSRHGSSHRFTFGFGRVEDLARVIVVLIIHFSAVVAAYQAVDRLLNPQPVALLWAVGAASLVGFIGNEAIFRIRVGGRSGSAALRTTGERGGQGILEAELGVGA
jgi:divalent metal cation (Fe/Co/Zn/Cd) transporter